MYQTNPRRVLWAVVVATLFCSLVTTFDYLSGLYRSRGAEYFQEYAVSKGLWIFKIAWFAWIIGFVVFAAWPWSALHRRGYRTLPTAVIAGALSTFFGQFMLSTGFLTACVGNVSSSVGGVPMWKSGVLTVAGWQRAFNHSLTMMVIGVFAAAILWRIAYRKAI